ncbi:MAG: hypothetical protein IPK12_23745 [Gemmatimonadetes bacterium]|nr:hypothetical protein [Gemmatimonadota bacterium]
MRRLTIAALPLLLLTGACEDDAVACTEEFRMIVPVVVDSTGAPVGDYGGRSILRATGDTLHEIHEGSAGPRASPWRTTSTSTSSTPWAAPWT